MKLRALFTNIFMMAAAISIPMSVLAADDSGQPYRIASPDAVSISPETDGTWEELVDGTSVWKYTVSKPGAAHLNFGFGSYAMPEGCSLKLYAQDMSKSIRPFTAQDNKPSRQLWTPVLLTDEVIIEVNLPSGTSTDALELELTQINVGFRGFGTNSTSIVERYLSGACNVDVVCSEGDDWCEEIPTVGVYTLNGIDVCSGFIVNNVAEDRTPYFMTANHCGITSTNDASVVVYWNYETSVCGLNPPDGPKTQFQTGSSLRASDATSDFALLELANDPDPTWCVAFAGWDRNGGDPPSAVAIHHPSCDEKRISFENDPVQTTSYFAAAVPGDGTHIRVISWDAGTTEPGSSGSPLFDQNHRAVGQLHGGNAACSNALDDWYGRFSVSWNGGGTSATRLSDWLDPGNTGRMQTNTLPPSNCPQCEGCAEIHSCGFWIFTGYTMHTNFLGICWSWCKLNWFVGFKKAFGWRCGSCPG